MAKIGVRLRGKGIEKKYRYQVNFRAHRKAVRYYKTIEADSKDEARSIGAELLTQERQVKIGKIEIKDDTVAYSAIETFITNDLASDGASPNTIKRYVGTCKTFFKDFLPIKHPEITKMSELSSAVFGDYKDYLYASGRKDGWTAEIGVIKPVFSRLVRRKRCSKEVYEELKTFKRPKPKEKEFTLLSKTEKKALLDVIHTNRADYWGITYFILRTAWRINEVCSILRKNVKPNGLQFVSIRSEIEDRKIKKLFTYTAIDDDFNKMLQKFMFDGRKTLYLFPNREGKKHSYRHYEEYLAKVSQESLSKRLTPTDLRKTTITEMVQAGISPNDLMAITGHLDYETVIKFYSKSTEDGKRKALEATKI